MTIDATAVIHGLLWVMGGGAALLAAVLGILGRALLNRLSHFELTIQQVWQFERRITRLEGRLGIDNDAQTKGV